MINGLTQVPQVRTQGSLSGYGKNENIGLRNRDQRERHTKSWMMDDLSRQG